MTLSRRSFLKAAGLTVVAAAGASMFTGCSNVFSTTPIVLEADGDIDSLTDWNKKKLVVYPGDASGAYLDSYLKSYLPNALNVKDFNNKYDITKKEYKEDDVDGKKVKKLHVTLKAKASN